ncbi:MAG: hypothetical protein RLZZ306_2972 [Bacteroidota bacterium]|jgi:hypothetical protein
MKKMLTIFSFFLFSCGGNSEMEQLKKENAALAEQVRALKSGSSAKPIKYILKIRLKQANFTLNIKKHIQNAVNSIDFEIPVDKEFYDSVSKGTEIIDDFRFGSLILSGSFGDWEMTVKDKEIRER